MGLDAREMWQGYLADATEAFQEIEQSLLSLEADPKQTEHINRLYRGLHTLKGNSGFLGLANVERLAHCAEDLCGLVRDKGVPLDDVITELMLEVLDRLRPAVALAAEHQADVDEEMVRDLVMRVVKHSSTALEGQRNPPQGKTKKRSAPPSTPKPARAATPPPPRVSEPAPEAEPAAPSFAMAPEIAPWEDAEFIEIFLGLARDKMDEVSGALVSIAGLVPGATELASEYAHLHELVDDLRMSAEHMQYERVLFALDRVLEVAKGGAPEAASIASWERELYAELVKIEENYRAIANEPASFPFIALYSRSCADNVFASLARLRTLIDANSESFSRQEASEIPSLCRELRSSCDYYGFHGGSRSCLDQEDLYCRALSERESLDPALVQRTREFISALGEAVEAVNRGEEGVDIASGEQANDPMKYTEEVAQFGFSDELELVVTRTNLGAISELAAGGKKGVYEVRADLDEATGGAFFAWIGENEIVCITSATVYVGDVTHFDFLLVSPLDEAAMEAGLRKMDPGMKRLRLRVPAKGGAPPEAIAAPLPSPRAATSLVTTQSEDALQESVSPIVDQEVERTPPDEPEREDAPPKGARRNQDTAGAASDFLRIDARKVSLIMDLAGEIGLATGAVTHHPDVKDQELEGFTAAAHKLEMLIRELQNEVSSMRLVPVAGVFQRMRRVVRDTARRTGKQVELILRGEDTEIDKIMVDSLHDPLVHMLRNAIDHGLETPEERRAAGKPETGTLVLDASHEAGEVSIGLSDDGRGIDKDRVLARALERGLLQPSSRPSEQELLAMIFEPGFSTKQEVSELSGRGVGMDVVKTTVEGLRGRVNIKTSVGKGTRFTLRMPLTLAFIEAMAIEQRGRLYVLPIEKVFEVFKAGRSQLCKSSAEGNLLVRVRDTLVPVCWIHRFYGDVSDGGAAPTIEDVVDKIVVVVQTAMGKLALPVDDLLGNQQVMLKPMRGVLSKIRASAGCGMLRTGDVAVALDCDALHA